MNRKLKFNTKDQPIYFWGCAHINHAKDFIFKARGFNSVEEHAEHILNKLNELPPNSLVFMLGDMFLNTEVSQAETFLDKINCRLVYILGNHEGAMWQIYRREIFNYYRQEIEVYPFSLKNVMFVGNYLECEINKKGFVLSHFPFKVWNNSKRGVIHLHSHNHGGLPSSLPEYKEGLILDCGVDVFPNGPVSFEKVMEIMATKKLVSFDDHH